MLVITGTNFTGTGFTTTAVSVGGFAVGFVVNSATQITATLAVAASGTVVVTTPGGTASQGGFSYTGPPPAKNAGADEAQQAQQRDGLSGLALDASTLRVFPNPTPSELSVEFFCARPARLRLTVRTVLGIVLLREESEASSSGVVRKELDLSTFSAGVYFVELSDGVQRTVAKFVKQ